MIPGISSHPDLEARLMQELGATNGRCSQCRKAQILAKYRRKLEERLRRDKLINKP